MHGNEDIMIITMIILFYIKAQTNIYVSAVYKDKKSDISEMRT